MKDLLEHLFEHNTLNCDEAKEILTKISHDLVPCHAISPRLNKT